MSRVNELNRDVSEAIWIAEWMWPSEPGYQEAWRRVADLEEALAGEFPPTVLQGQVAREGAVRAARIAGQPERARALLDRFLAEPDTGDALRAGLHRAFTARLPTRPPKAGRSARPPAPASAER